MSFHPLLPILSTLCRGFQNDPALFQLLRPYSLCHVRTMAHGVPPARKALVRLEELVLIVQAVPVVGVALVVLRRADGARSGHRRCDPDFIHAVRWTHGNLLSRGVGKCPSFRAVMAAGRRLTGRHYPAKWAGLSRLPDRENGLLVGCHNRNYSVPLEGDRSGLPTPSDVFPDGQRYCTSTGGESNRDRFAESDCASRCHSVQLYLRASTENWREWPGSNRQNSWLDAPPTGVYHFATFPGCRSFPAVTERLFSDDFAVVYDVSEPSHLAVHGVIINGHGFPAGSCSQSVFQRRRVAVSSPNRAPQHVIRPIFNNKFSASGVVALHEFSNAFLEPDSLTGQRVLFSHGVGLLIVLQWF